MVVVSDSCGADSGGCVCGLSFSDWVKKMISIWFLLRFPMISGDDEYSGDGAATAAAVRSLEPMFLNFVFFDSTKQETLFQFSTHFFFSLVLFLSLFISISFGLFLLTKHPGVFTGSTYPLRNTDQLRHKRTRKHNVNKVLIRLLQFDNFGNHQSMSSHSVTVATAAAAAVKQLLFHPSFSLPTQHCDRRRISSSLLAVAAYSTTLSSSTRSRKKLNRKDNSVSSINNRRVLIDSVVKRRTRSDKKFDEDSFRQFGDTGSHIPVMLGEVLEVFDSRTLHTFVDCTLGAAGHSSAIIQAHPEMQSYVGLDCDPVAHEKAKAKIDLIQTANSTFGLKTHTFLRNFKNIKSTLSEVDENLLISGINGILMDLGMSSMQVNDANRGFSVLCDGPLDMRMDPQASLTAEDILNSWPEEEIGQILRDYGEENKWRALQKRIVKARTNGGLHSTGELVDLIRGSTSGEKGGRQGWIKTATRVFQALRIAVNDELKTLETSLYDCYGCLAPGGRLAVISFHSLEDRIVKQTFLNIINSNLADGSNREASIADYKNVDSENAIEKESWIKQMIHGVGGTILTKRPVTPSEAEEKLNIRCRSAKLRVIQRN